MNYKTKSTIALIIMCVLALLCSCGKKKVVGNVDQTATTAGKSTFPQQSSAATNTEKIDKTVVYEANGLTVKTEGIDFSDKEKVRIKFRITSVSEYDLKVYIPKGSNGKNCVLVNGKEIQANLSKSLQKPETVVWMEMYWFQLRDSGIESIDDVVLKLAFGESGVVSGDPLYITDDIRISTTK